MTSICPLKIIQPSSEKDRCFPSLPSLLSPVYTCDLQCDFWREVSRTKRALPYAARRLLREAPRGLERKLWHISWGHSSIQFMLGEVLSQWRDDGVGQGAFCTPNSIENRMCKAPAKRGHIVAATLCPNIVARRADTRNVSEDFPKHFLCCVPVLPALKRGFSLYTPVSWLKCNVFLSWDISGRRRSRWFGIMKSASTHEWVTENDSLLTLSLPRVINLKFLVQPHQKYYVTQYEELGFS